MKALSNCPVKSLASCLMMCVLVSGCSRSNAQPQVDSPANEIEAGEVGSGQSVRTGSDSRLETLLQAAEQAEEAADFNAAAESLTAAVAVCRQLPTDMRDEALAATLAWLGNISTKRERYDDAVRFLREAEQLADQSKEPDVELQIAVGKELASALHASGQHQQAEQQIDSMIELTKRALSQQQQGERLLESLALKVSMQAARDQLLQAAETGEEMLAILNSQTDGDPADAALLLCEVAALWRDAGRVETANRKFAAAVKLTSAGAFDPEVAQAVFRACLEHCQKTGDTAGVNYFQRKLASEIPQTSQHPSTNAAPANPVVGMSEAKQLAYEDVMHARERLEEAEDDWEDQYHTWRATRDLSQQWAGRASALGVYHGTFEGRAPDPHTKREVIRARESYEKAVRRFQATR